MNILYRGMVLGFWIAASALAGADAQPQVNATGSVAQVRLGLVEGDVRISRGKRDENTSGMTWVQAGVGLEMKPGYSVATGSRGRAEVDFGDGSTMFLGEDSLLSFGKQSAKSGAVDLVIGTLTLDVEPLKGGWYAVRTPTDQVLVEYPKRALTRVNSYPDGVLLTALDGGEIDREHRRTDAGPGKAVYFNHGTANLNERWQRVSDKYLDFDDWVDERIAARKAASTAQPHQQPGLLMEPAAAPQLLSQSVWGPRRALITFDRKRQSFVIVNLAAPKTTATLTQALGGGPATARQGKGGVKGGFGESPGRSSEVGLAIFSVNNLGISNTAWSGAPPVLNDSSWSISIGP